MMWTQLCCILLVVGSSLLEGVPVVIPPDVVKLDARFVSLTGLKVTWQLTSYNSSAPFQQQMALGPSPDCDKRTVVNLTLDMREYELVTDPGAAVTLCMRTTSHLRNSHWSKRRVEPDIRWPPVITSPAEASEHLYMDEDPLGPERCLATGVPKPTITWYKEGNSEPIGRFPGDHVTVSASGDELSIKSATRSHEGRYYCVANNTYGTAVGPPVSYKYAYLDSFPANMNPPGLSVFESKPLKMECLSMPASVPAAFTRVIWMRATDDDGGEDGGVWGPGVSALQEVQSSENIMVADDGSLLFLSTQLSDAGTYRCKVKNEWVDEAQTSSEITVTVTAQYSIPQPPLELYHRQETRQAVLGQPFTIQCVFSGFPLPTVRWYHRGLPLEPSDRLVLGDYGRNLTVKPIANDRRRHDVFKCEGHNNQGTSGRLTTEVVYLDPPSFKKAPESVNATSGDNVTFECVPQGLMHAQTTWLVNGRPVRDLENTVATWRIYERGSVLHIDHVTKEAVMVVQCNVSNPQLYIYANAYLNVFDPPVITTQPRDLEYKEDAVYVFPCDIEGDPGLPLQVVWLWNDSLVNTSDPHIFVQDSHALRIDTRGLGDTGSNYIGEYTCVGDNTISKRSATAALKWRPKGKDVAPQTSPSIERESYSIFHRDNLWKSISVGLCIFVSLMLFGTLLVYVLRRKRQQQKRHPRRETETALTDMTHLNHNDRNGHAVVEQDTLVRYGNGAVCRCRSNSNSTQSHAGSAVSNLDALVEDLNLRSTVQEVYVDRDRFELGELIGKGQFGRVYAALLFNTKGQYDDKVAVKTLKYKAEETEMVELFLREAVMMKDFSHPHVLSLIGISFDCDASPMVILPYMSNGDLKQHIQDPDREVTILELLKFGLQVAKGMVYLSQKRFVHRDLACRNCMVDEHEIVKVADFGLSRDLFSRDYYRIEDGKTPLPVRWMAPECLQQNVFTSMSDVWSFGILLWELMTRGAVPFPDLDNWDVPKHIKSGRHLPQPAFCPDAVYSIMTTCWSMNPHHRCSFEQVVTDISAIVQGAKHPGRSDHNRNLYINIATAVVTRPDYRQTTV